MDTEKIRAGVRGHQAGFRRHGGRIADGFGRRLPRGARAKMLQLTPGCLRLSECGGSGGPAECRQHISRNRQNLHQGVTFRSRNVKRSRSCARRVTAYEPLLVILVAPHPRSLVSSDAMRHAATALQNTERRRHNGTRINPPDARSRRSWRSIRSCAIMCKTGLPV
jgi:hypothetical protein